ncbi:MAG: rod shape-determining protein MreD [Gemmatimonadaceae bacterium]
MSWGITVRTVLVCVVLIVLHFTLRPLLGMRAGIDFMLIALMFGSVRLRPGAAAVYGLLLGLIADSLSVSTFGSSALAMTVVGYAASWLKAVFFADNLALNAFFLFLGKWLFDVIYVLAERRLAGWELVMQLVAWSSLSAAATALAGVLVLALLRPLLEARTA